MNMQNQLQWWSCVHVYLHGVYTCITNNGMALGVFDVLHFVCLCIRVSYSYQLLQACRHQNNSRPSGALPSTEKE